MQQVMIRMTTFPGRHKTGLKRGVLIQKTIQPVCQYADMLMQLAIANRQLSANKEDVCRCNT
ncbi:hypothetical protein TU87_22320 [Pseudomonas weihenstephanensis]|nr:hypothetical protein TU87_22320 [Pseudomonas weihenstephanensis]